MIPPPSSSSSAAFKKVAGVQSVTESLLEMRNEIDEEGDPDLAEFLATIPIVSEEVKVEDDDVHLRPLIRHMTGM